MGNSIFALVVNIFFSKLFVIWKQVNEEVVRLRAIGAQEMKLFDLLVWRNTGGKELIALRLNGEGKVWVAQLWVRGWIVAEDKLTNGFWAFNRSTMSRLFTTALEKGGMIEWNDLIAPVTLEFSLCDRIVGKGYSKIDVEVLGGSVHLGNVKQDLRKRIHVGVLGHRFAMVLYTGTASEVVEISTDVDSELVYSSIEDLNQKLSERVIDTLRSIPVSDQIESFKTA